MTRAGIDLGEPLGDSQRERNPQVELPAAPWVWISSSSPGDTGSCHEDKWGTPALILGTQPVLAGLRAALEPELGGRRARPPPRTSRAIQGQAGAKVP